MAAGQETRHPFCAAVPGARALSLNRSQTPLPFSEGGQTNQIQDRTCSVFSDMFCPVSDLSGLPLRTGGQTNQIQDRTCSVFSDRC